MSVPAMCKTCQLPLMILNPRLREYPRRGFLCPPLLLLLLLLLFARFISTLNIKETDGTHHQFKPLLGRCFANPPKKWTFIANLL